MTALFRVRWEVEVGRGGALRGGDAVCAQDNGAEPVHGGFGGEGEVLGGEAGDGGVGEPAPGDDDVEEHQHTQAEEAALVDAVVGEGAIELELELVGRGLKVVGHVFVVVVEGGGGF